MRKQPMQTDNEGIKVLEMIMDENPNAKVIMLSIHEEEEDLIFRMKSSTDIHISSETIFKIAP